MADAKSLALAELRNARVTMWASDRAYALRCEEAADLIEERVAFCLMDPKEDS